MAAATGDRWLLADTLAIVAGIFSLFCRRTIATWMRALSNFLLCHGTHLAFLSVLTSIRPTALEINPGPPQPPAKSETHMSCHIRDLRSRICPVKSATSFNTHTGGPSSHLVCASVVAGGNFMPATARRVKEPQSETLPLEERIRRRAYELYVQRGNQSGSELDDWLRAEEEIRRATDQAIDEASEESFPASDPPAY